MSLASKRLLYEPANGCAAAGIWLDAVLPLIRLMGVDASRLSVSFSKRRAWPAGAAGAALLGSHGLPKKLMGGPEDCVRLMSFSLGDDWPCCRGVALALGGRKVGPSTYEMKKQ
jgi:hypothetical protein